MSDKQIVVPEGMRKSAEMAAMELRCDAPYEQTIRVGLEAALLWLTEELGKSDGIAPMLGGTYQDGWVAAWRHIIRLFDPNFIARKPEPKPFDPTLGGVLSGRTFTQEQADQIKERVQMNVHFMEKPEVASIPADNKGLYPNGGTYAYPSAEEIRDKILHDDFERDEASRKISSSVSKITTIQDLLLSEQDPQSEAFFRPNIHNKKIIEAYKRGLQAGKESK